MREGREEKGKVSRSTDDTISTVGMNMRSTLPPCSQQKRCEERKEKEEGGEERDEDTLPAPPFSLLSYDVNTTLLQVMIATDETP